MAKVKITVLRRMVYEDLVEEYTNREPGPCARFSDGQEFILDTLAMPADFCSWAWADLHRDVISMALGGNRPAAVYKQSGTAIACCTDGLSPVIFKVERID